MTNINDFRDTIKYPTSLIVRGAEPLGLELAMSLLDQGGFVIIADTPDREDSSVIHELKKYKLFKFLDLSEIPSLGEFLRRLDYVFYFAHSFEELDNKISSKDFLEYSRFLDDVLSLAGKFESKLLATTSIKAHQYNVANKLLETTFSGGDSGSPIYTASEIQRYSESLVGEYSQKESLDTRIVRLGELIGVGIEYSPHTTLGRLIKESLKNNELVIYGDGLESEYYIHLQDAVYGLIKSQFSKNTRAETFTLAYEYEVSTLSIAYKINDFSEEPKEIKFSNKTGSDFGFRLYKPAPNLMRVGWKPRISFERALKQTYEYAKKIFTVEYSSDPEQKKDKKNIISKIFFEDSTEEELEEDSGGYGALGRLISERKSRDKDRHGSILLANKHMASRIKKESTQSLKDRVVISFRKSFDKFTRKYRWIKNLTVRQFLFYTISFVLFLYIYINIFSVILSFSRNMYIVYKATENEVEYLKNNDKDSIKLTVEYTSSQLDLARTKIDTFDYLDFWPEYIRFADNFDILYYALRTVNNGILSTLNGAEPISDYLLMFDPQIVYRPNSKSLLSSQNMNEFIDDDSLEVKMILLEDGLNVVEGGVEMLKKFPYEYFRLNDSQIEVLINEYIPEVTGFHSLYSGYLKTLNILNTLVQAGEEKMFVFIFVDNGYYLPSGGNLVGILTVDLNKGRLSGINLSSLNLDNRRVSITTDYLINRINLVSTHLVSKENIVMEDLLLLTDGDLYLDSLSRELSVREGKRIDGIAVINIGFLEELLEIVGASEFDGIKFDHDTLQANLDLLAGESQNPTVYRKDVITNIYAVSIQHMFNTFNSKLVEIVTLIESSLENKNIVFRSYLAGSENNFTDNLTDQVVDYISVSVINDENGVEVRIAPQYSLKINTLIHDNYSTRKTITINHEETQNIGYVIVCLPAGSSNFSFNEQLDEAKSLRFGEDESCIRFNADTSGEIQFGYDSLSSINNINSRYDYSLGVRKQPGADVNYEFTFSTENLYIIEDTEDGIVDKVQQLEYSDTLITDKILGFNFTLDNQDN